MTNPIPGADSERELFEAKTLEQFAAATFDKYPSGSYRVGWVQDQWIGWQAARAAAKVGANVCVNSAALADLACPTCHGTGQICVGRSGHESDGNGPVMEPCSECGYFDPIAAGAPAETPKPVYLVRYTSIEGWRVASEEAYWTFSECNRRILYEAAQPAPIAGDVEKDAVCLDPVVEANRALLHQRSQLGIKKYGGTLDEMRHSHRALMQHSLEEALDLANYLQAEIQAVDRAAMLANSSSGEAG